MMVTMITKQPSNLMCAGDWILLFRRNLETFETLWQRLWLRLRLAAMMRRQCKSSGVGSRGPGLARSQPMCL